MNDMKKLLAIMESAISESYGNEVKDIIASTGGTEQFKKYYDGVEDFENTEMFKELHNYFSNNTDMFYHLMGDDAMSDADWILGQVAHYVDLDETIVPFDHEEFPQLDDETARLRKLSGLNECACNSGITTVDTVEQENHSYTVNKTTADGNININVSANGYDEMKRLMSLVGQPVEAEPEVQSVEIDVDQPAEDNSLRDEIMARLNKSLYNR